MKILKKFLKIILCVAVIVIAIFLIVSAEKKQLLKSFSQQLFNYTLPINTKLLDTDSHCGILHNGNSTTDNYTATLLVHSELSRDELFSYYNVATDSFSSPNNSICLDVSAATYENYLPFFTAEKNHFGEGPYPFCIDYINTLKDTENIYYVCIQC